MHTSSLLTGLVTPALLLDAEKMQRNMQRLDDHARGLGVTLRPDVKDCQIGRGHQTPVQGRHRTDHGVHSGRSRGLFRRGLHRHPLLRRSCPWKAGAA